MQKNFNKETWTHQVLHSHKARCSIRSDQDEQIGKTRIDALSRGDKDISVRGRSGSRQSVTQIDGDVPKCMRNKDKDVGMKSKEIERTRGEGGG